MSIASEISALQTDKTNIANAITAKGGTVNSGDGYDDFSTDIGTITPSYFGAITKTLNNLFNAAIFPQNTNLKLENTQNLQTKTLESVFSNAQNLISIDLTLSISPTSLSYTFSEDSSTNTPTEYIRLNFDTSQSTTLRGTFQNKRNLKKIEGTLDASLCTASTAKINTFAYCSSLEEVTFAANSIKIGFTLAASPNLKDSALVSVANGLDSTISGETIALSNNSKARCSTLMGTVTDGVFTQDDTGTVSLQTFITDEKGWTLA